MALSPHPDLDALHRAAGEALGRRDAKAARPLFERLVAARPMDVQAGFGLAIACHALGDAKACLGALDRVLAIEPRHLPALLMKADHFAAAGDGRAAETFYRAVVNRAPPLETLPPDLREEVRRAGELSAQYAKAFEVHLRATVARAGFDPAGSSRRFAQSLDLLTGAKQIYFQAPTSYYFPELPQRQFYEREEFLWITAFEAQAPLIRAELSGLIADHAAFRPYMRSDSSRPPADYHGLRDNLGWSAYHLIESGEVAAEAAARCPATIKALSEVPLCASPGRTPSVLFSLLRPGARIPPHHGQINARLICHLPLITPPGCALRVGNETRPWIRDQCLIFDDTIEHEAWNTSGEVRVVLLLDIWRPELSAEERELVAALLGAVGSVDGAG